MTKKASSAAKPTLLDSLWNAFFGWFGSKTKTNAEAPAPISRSKHSEAGTWPLSIRFIGRPPKNGETVELRFVANSVNHKSVNGLAFEAEFQSANREARILVPTIIAECRGVRVAVSVAGERVGTNYPLDGSTVMVNRR